MLRLTARVSDQKRGLREDDLDRMYHVFLPSHINCAASALVWTKMEKNKLNTLMCKSIKRVLSLPITTTSDRLDQLGIHDNIDENVHAQVSKE